MHSNTDFDVDSHGNGQPYIQYVKVCIFVQSYKLLKHYMHVGMLKCIMWSACACMLIFMTILCLCRVSVAMCLCARQDH